MNLTQVQSSIATLVQNIDIDEYLSTINFLKLQEDAFEKQLQNLLTVQSQLYCSTKKLVDHNQQLIHQSQQFSLNINALVEVQNVIKNSTLPNDIMEQCSFVSEQNFEQVLTHLPHICHIQQHYKELPIENEQQKFEIFLIHFINSIESFLLNILGKKEMSIYKDQFQKLRVQTDYKQLEDSISSITQKVYLELMKYHEFIQFLIENDRHIQFFQVFLQFHQFELDYIQLSLKNLDKLVQKWIKDQTFFSTQNGYFPIFQSLQQPKMKIKLFQNKKQTSLAQNYHSQQIEQSLSKIVSSKLLIDEMISTSCIFLINKEYNGSEDNQFTGLLQILNQINFLTQIAAKKQNFDAIFGPYRIDSIKNPAKLLLLKLLNSSFQCAVDMIQQLNDINTPEAKFLTDQFLNIFRDNVEQVCQYQKYENFQSWLPRILAVIIQVKSDVFAPVKAVLIDQINQIEDQQIKQFLFDQM
uniref:Uncharacterized protein n=2 Tax=Spironucleus salmonicida TaxID=348837 RepID=V6LWW3_9EUKA|eukprot:EST45294.1 Hypothetical protein SS50377_14871 [Spironucleus salmonicida]